MNKVPGDIDIPVVNNSNTIYGKPIELLYICSSKYDILRF